jgi:hypothetical protein
MLNPHNANEELGSRMVELLLKARLSGVFSEDELRDMSYGMGISVEWRKQATLERIQSMLEDALCQAASDSAELERVKRIGHGLPPTPRFAETGCSQCGGSFGPGDHGYSHCKDHGGSRY